MNRRTLKFTDLDAAVADAELLVSKGYDKAGNWDLSQVCGHLTNWLSYPLDGYPPLPIWLKPIFWVMRTTMKNKIPKMMFSDDGMMKPGMSTAPTSIPAPGGDDRTAVAKFKAAVERWQKSDGPVHASPLLGLLTKECAEEGHRIHAAHHLSFLIPKQ
jgi:hypothetical protein